MKDYEGSEWTSSRRLKLNQQFDEDNQLVLFETTNGECVCLKREALVD